jgi:hypothetical protein
MAKILTDDGFSKPLREGVEKSGRRLSTNPPPKPPVTPPAQGVVRKPAK